MRLRYAIFTPVRESSGGSRLIYSLRHHMPASSYWSWIVIAAMLVAVVPTGYDIYLRIRTPVSPPTIIHDPPTAEDIAKATEPIKKELDAANSRLASITGDRDNLSQQLDALRQKPAHASADEMAKATASIQKQLDAVTRQRDAALSDAVTLRRRVQQLEAVPHAASAPPPAAGISKVYTQRTIAELRGFYEGPTALQGDVFMADEKGKWIETRDVRIQGIGTSGVLLLKKDNSGFQCTFDDTSKTKLSTLRVGNIIKTITGKISQNQNGQLIYLEDCELRD